jgi:hypothetical protein
LYASACLKEKQRKTIFMRGLKKIVESIPIYIIHSSCHWGVAQASEAYKVFHQESMFAVAASFFRVVSGISCLVAISQESLVFQEEDSICNHKN